MAAACVIAVTGACRPDPSNGPDAAATPLAGRTVPLVLPAGTGLADAWRIAITEWEAAAGAQCDVREVDFSGEGASDLDAPDGALVVCPLTVLPQLHRLGGLAAIPEDVSTGWADLFDGLRRTIGSPGGRPCVVPLSAPPLLCIYRADLLDAAGLAPPTTWEEYRSLASTIDQWAPQHSVVEPWGEDFRASMFLARSAGSALHPDNFSFCLDVGTAEPLVESLPFVETLRRVQEDMARLDPASLMMTPYDCYDAVAAGRAALAIGMRPRRSGPVGDAAPGIGISALPGAARTFHSEAGTWSELPDGEVNRVSVVGYDGWAVCVTGDDDPSAHRAAWLLWSAINDPENRGHAAEDAVRGPTGSTGLAETPSAASPESRELQRDYLKAVSQSLGPARVVPDLPLPSRSRFRDRLTQRVTEAIVNDRPAEESLAALASDWRVLIDEVDRQAVLDTYRWSLGLSPLSLPEPPND